jgi:CHAT domain-containing protein
VNLEKPFSSAILLAPEDGNPDLLYAHEISGIRLSPETSVILAACATARGKDMTMEGAVSLARGFLSAGARAVIASHRSVEDETTRSLLVSFHRSLRQTGSPVAALRSAQVAAIKGRQNPAGWAMFTVLGNRRAL